MEKSAQPASMDNALSGTVTCPACGLLCDDLVVENTHGNIKVRQKGCAKSVTFFERPQQNPSPRIAGKTADLQSAIKKTAEILRNANQPLITGLGTEAHGMRAIMSLADRAGATLDHMNSNGTIRNTLVLQNSGWQVCTLTEVRNRVDLLVIVGTDIVSLFPRFFERHVWNEQSMFGQDTAAREVVYLGGRDIDTTPGISPKGVQPGILPCTHWFPAKNCWPRILPASRPAICKNWLIACSPPNTAWSPGLPPSSISRMLNSPYKTSQD